LYHLVPSRLIASRVVSSRRFLFCHFSSLRFSSDSAQPPSLLTPQAPSCNNSSPLHSRRRHLFRLSPPNHSKKCTLHRSRLSRKHGRIMGGSL
jgi:hypothetical protein